MEDVQPAYSIQSSGEPEDPRTIEMVPVITHLVISEMPWGHYS